MRYVGLAEFLKLPPGTVYMLESNPGQPFYGLSHPIKIKGETVSAGVADWLESDLVDIDGYDSSELFNKLHEAFFEKAALTIDPEPAESRHGLYPSEGDVAFWVLDEQDTEVLIEILRNALVRQRETHAVRGR